MPITRFVQPCSSDLQRFQHGLSSARPGSVPISAREGNVVPWTIGNQHSTAASGPDKGQQDSQSFYSIPSQFQGHLSQRFDSFPLQLFLFPMAVGALPPPMAQFRAELPELHIPNAPPALQGKEQLLLPSETLHCWELSCRKLVSCMVQAVSACKAKGAIFANRFCISYSIFIVLWLRFICMVF